MLRSFTILLFLLLNVQLFGHGELSEQIVKITHRIEQEPNNANLYLKRGQLYAQHDEFIPAKKDYERARMLDERLSVTDLLMAQLYAQNNRADTALIYANVFLKQHPDHPNALISRAGIYQQLGMRDSCQKDLELAMANIKEPNPSHFISIVEAVLLADTTNVEEALSWLEKGQERFGFDIVLKSKEIDLFVLTQQYDHAILTIDDILAHFPRKEKWLFQKALIYERAGKPDLAKTQYTATLEAIQQLPKRLQRTTKILELEIQTLEKIEMLSK